MGVWQHYITNAMASNAEACVGVLNQRLWDRLIWIRKKLLVALNLHCCGQVIWKREWRGYAETQADNAIDHEITLTSLDTLEELLVIVRTLLFHTVPSTVSPADKQTCFFFLPPLQRAWQAKSMPGVLSIKTHTTAIIGLIMMDLKECEDSWLV